MPKPRGKCVLNAELSKLWPFIKKTKSDSDLRCGVCNAEFSIGNAGRKDIEKHLTTKKHTDKLQASASSHPLTNYLRPTTDYTTARMEGVWTYHVIQANHSFKSSDCASKVFRTCFAIKQFQCARTKCEAITTNVFAPYSIDTLKKDLAERHYISISTDESNRGNIKMVPVVVRFFVPLVGVQVKMLEFSSEKGGTSQIIADLLAETCPKNELMDKVVAFCADNCPTNFGSRERGGQRNVFYRLKQLWPMLIGIGCGAHIVHNSLQSACQELPIDIKYVVVKIYSQFYRSTVQVEALKILCDAADMEYTKLLGYAKTRFLALGPAIGTILKLFDPLKEYFLGLRRCPIFLKTFFESPLAKLWLLFIHEQVMK